MLKKFSCFILFTCLASLFSDLFAQNRAEDQYDKYAETPILGIPVSETLPVLYIETENQKPIESKTEYINAKYWLTPFGDGEYDAVGSQDSPLDMQIRGRGHSSWNAPKKPYKLKLSEKISILGMSKNKHWALIKPSEATVAGFRLGRLMNMAWTPDFRPVEVVLNNVNIGLYFLMETIRIDKNRVDIYEQPDLETDPDLICGGWLVEVDNYIDDCQITVPEHPRWNLTIKYHSPENLSDSQYKWLRAELIDINDAVYSKDKTSTEWEDHFDVESMARFFIIQEILDNPDGFHGSFYLHKDLGNDAKWVAGPLWDLSCYNREKTDYTFRMPVHYNITPHWIGEIIQYDSFCRAVQKVWEEVYPDRLGEIYDYIDRNVLCLKSAWEQNRKIWDEDPSITVQTRSDNLKKALKGNIEWFNDHLPESAYSGISDIMADRASTRVYNIQGILIGEFENREEAISDLKQGLYIIDNEKVIIR